MLVNGSRATTLPLDNRGLAYGDGLFETIRVHKQKLLFIEAHLERLSLGLDTLGIQNCVSNIRDDIASIESKLPEEGVLKVVVTRGAGGRGYRPDNNAGADRILTLHPLPPSVAELLCGVKTFVCKTRLQHSSLAGLKHLNRLEQVLASKEWPDLEVHEGLMLDTSERVIEGTRSNIFIGHRGRLMTPDLAHAGVAGILRQEIIREFPETIISTVTLNLLEQAEELFFCNSVAGVWPVSELITESGHVLEYTPGEWCNRAGAFFHTALDNMT